MQRLLAEMLLLLYHVFQLLMTILVEFDHLTHDHFLLGLLANATHGHIQTVEVGLKWGYVNVIFFPKTNQKKE